MKTQGIYADSESMAINVDFEVGIQEDDKGKIMFVKNPQADVSFQFVITDEILEKLRR